MNLADHVEPICRALLGDQNPNYSTKAEWRYGSNGSLAIKVTGQKKGGWFDHERREGGGLLDLIKRQRGCEAAEAFEWLRSIGVPLEEKRQSRRAVAEYVYKDIDQQPQFKVTKWASGARFTQSRYDQATGKYVSGKGCMRGVELIPYRLPEWRSAGLVVIVEGEKDADALWALEIMATTNPGGAGKWESEFSRHFAAQHQVAILPDNDDPGRAHAADVARSLLNSPACWVRVLELQGLPAKGDVSDWLATSGTKDQLLDLIKKAPEAKDWLAGQPEPEPEVEPKAERECPYEAKAAGIIWWKDSKDGPLPIQLTNFTATVVGEVERDDGAERSLRFEIEASLAGRRYRFEVAAAEFNSLSWATREMGARALIYPGFAIRDHARAAVQMLSTEIERRQVFGHLGWREVAGFPVYLHSGGAIGASGLRSDIETDLGDLNLFILPAPPEGAELQRSIQASLAILDVAPLAITVPVYSAIWRAVLDSSDITVHELGRTGILKSQLAALAQQHWGPGLDANHLTTWASTGNSLEGVAFTAKDALLVVDDFAPSGAPSEIARTHREAARYVRAQGNRLGRQRCRSDGSVKAAKPPRGLTLSTGEEVPGGWSVRARMLIVDVAEGDIDAAKLTNCQEDAGNGVYAAAMAGYLQWLASNLRAARARYLAFRKSLRNDATGKHRRTPWAIAELGAGLQLFLEFAGAMHCWEDCWRALLTCAAAQGEHQASEDPARRFVELIQSALTSKVAHVADSELPDRPPQGGAGDRGWQLCAVGANEEWQPRGPCIGWANAEILYLDPEAAYATASKLANAQDRALGVGSKTLWKRLAEAGLLQLHDRDRNTYKVKIGARLRNTIALALYISEETGKSGNAGNALENPRETLASFPDSVSRFPGAGRKIGKSESGKNAEGNRRSQSSNPVFPDFPDPGGMHTPEGGDEEPWADDPAEQQNWSDDE